MRTKCATKHLSMRGDEGEMFGFLPKEIQESHPGCAC